LSAAPRVLQALAGAEHGGAEAFFDRLVGALARAGVTQHVLTRDHPARLARLRAAGLAPVALRFGGWLDGTTRRRFRAEIARFRPDLVLTWMSRATAFCPAPPVAGQRFLRVGRLGGYYDAKYYRGCDHLIANTADIRDWLIGQGFAAETVHHLPNFVDAVTAPPVDRATLDTPQAAPLLLALGRLHPNKAFDVLIDALAALPDAYLWLAGEGDARAALARRAAERGVAPRLRWLGWRDDVPALLAAADILVCASRHEPLGNVVIEGWAHGVAVVAAASQGPRALIRDAADGLLTPVDDAGALAAAVRRLIDDAALRAALARAGRARYEASFTEPAVVGRYRAFFNQVCG
jgi:glycosyltransferase involved in cell wall biosynthesis